MVETFLNFFQMYGGALRKIRLYLLAMLFQPYLLLLPQPSDDVMNDAFLKMTQCQVCCSYFLIKAKEMQSKRPFDEAILQLLALGCPDFAKS